MSYAFVARRPVDDAHLCIHPRLTELYWSSGTIYDILCFAFFFTALLYYLRKRERGPVTNPLHCAIVLALYVCALDSKEIAVVFPATLLLYECVCLPRPNLRLPLLATLIALPYIWGKTRPGSPLRQVPNFQPHFSLQQFLTTYGAYLDDIFLHTRLPEAAVAVVLLVLLLCALLLRSRLLIFAWAFLMCSALPIAFVPPRTMYAFYIPFAGWSLYAAAVLVELWQRVVRSPRAVGVLEFRQAALFVIVLLLLVDAYHIQRLRMGGDGILGQPIIRGIVTQLDAQRPVLPRGVRVLAIGDPFPKGEYALLLLLRLYFRDPNLEVDHGDTNGNRHLAVLQWRNGKLSIETPRRYTGIFNGSSP